jgi:aerobic carbon-monoxide dehydrogenase large subunit
MPCAEIIMTAVGHTTGNTIGASLPRSNALRLLTGRGQYVDDLNPPRGLHAAVLRSPYAHARIVALDVAAAAAAPGVARVLTGRDVAKLCDPYVGVLKHVAGMQSAPQWPLAVERACWQGEPVALVVAATRAEAEDALALIEVEWEELPAVTDAESALDPQTPVIHPGLGSNLCFERVVEAGDVAAAFAQADHVIEAEFNTGRHTAVTLEPRSILADFNAADGQLTVWHSTQVPYMMQWILARHFRLPETQVRVIAPDVGGGFGMKIHIYGDEMAAVAASLLLGRPVKFVADRLESFVGDFHARGHRVRARMALTKTGEILGVEADDLYGIGAYSGYPRGSANEGLQVSNLVCAAYRRGAYRAVSRAVFQNKAMYGQYRAVGHPIACLVSEGLMDLAAATLNEDPAEFRRRNYIRPDSYPLKLPGGPVMEKLSQHEALEQLLQMMDYRNLRAEQTQLRAAGVHRGIGLASFVENSNPSAATYGQGGVSIASQDSCTLKLTATGGVVAASSITECGQGGYAVIQQVVAAVCGVPFAQVKVVLGDTETTPVGGGVWGSRGTGICGEAALQAGKALKANILAFVARLQESEASLFDIRDGRVIQTQSGAEVMTLEAVARTAYFRTDQVPQDFQPELTVTRSYAQKTYNGAYTNGIQASYLEVDTDTGFVKLLGHWVVDDCGTIINPLLVDEQIRGACVQGIGAALFEQCLYSAEGQLLNGSLMDYLVPMAGEMPDIAVGHTCTPTGTSELGAKGAGEAGTAGASAAVLNAVNDALRPLGGAVFNLPVTPESILRALQRLPPEFTDP